MRTDGKRLSYQYKNHLCDYRTWDQLDHATDWLLFPENMGEFLSLDETSMSNGELYTLLTNKQGKGGRGSIVAIVKGTKSSEIIDVYKKIEISKCNKVKEISVDMAGSMNLVVKECFKFAQYVTDRFHVQKLASEAVQEIRIKHRWQEIERENEAITQCKKENKPYQPIIHLNGDTPKQLLARSRYILYKSPSNWSEKQKERAKILFENYPEIKKAYNLAEKLKYVFENHTDKGTARLALAKWYNLVENEKIKNFNTIVNTIHHHYNNILNYFDNRSTNASAEFFNAKIKAFRAQFRGIRDLKFFFFRLCEVYA